MSIKKLALFGSAIAGAVYLSNKDRRDKLMSSANRFLGDARRRGSELGQTAREKASQVGERVQEKTESFQSGRSPSERGGVTNADIVEPTPGREGIY